MIVKSYKKRSDGTFGVRIDYADRDRHFSPEWDAVDIEIDGTLHRFEIRETFWKTCPEFCGPAVKEWLFRNNRGVWDKGKPHPLLLLPAGGQRFRLSLPPESGQ